LHTKLSLSISDMQDMCNIWVFLCVFF